ncbi:MAG: phnG [Devosia sp.]|uniref:phosphonate C-P lyase system protein PhnG n=1 Tax=Devosia sp. TaxID=1871048 RepID=UPI00260AB6FE|nr:phosphonate C-P lyase system protein PhnG [Devosia sp.]MDB5585538.1 phnG [Devosia sp.]
MTVQPVSDTDPRRLALNALAAADAEALAAAWSNWADKPDFKPVRGPETGLVMVRGRAGGGGAPFNLGEASVSRATVRLDSGEIGHGYCLGRDLDKARLIAVFDALFQRDPATVEAQILTPLRAGATAADLKRKQETAATKVNFFTMVRGDN